MLRILETCITRSRTTLLILFMILMTGIIARLAIPVEYQPNVEAPFFAVVVPHEGISPEDAERLLVMPLELEIRQIEGVEEVTGYASEGSGQVWVEFDPEADFEASEQDLRNAVDRAKIEFPSTAEEPFIQEENIANFPIIQINLTGDVPERMLFNLARDMRDEIEKLGEILSANIDGGREEVMEIVIDPRALETYQISSELLMNSVIRNNRLIPAGSLDTGNGRFSVKVPSIIEDPLDVLAIPVKTVGDTVVTLSDVASVRPTFKERQGYARIDGRNGLALFVVKRSDANILEAIEKTKQVIEQFKSKIPGKITISYSSDQGPYAKSQLVELEGNIVTAMGIVMVIVVAAMGFRNGVIVGLAIPSSFLFALIFVYLVGYSFNFMVMFGMILGLGMLIDGAIVVTEYADRKMIEGHEKQEAYILAANRMFWPVTASIATTLAAFLPLMFWPGISGQFMRYLPVTVFMVLSGSLLYALIFGPTIGSIIGKAGEQNDESKRQLKSLEHGDPRELRTVTGFYARALSFTARHSVSTLLVTLAMVTSVFWAYGEYGKGMIFFSDTDVRMLRLEVKARGNLSVDEAYQLTKEVEERILPVEGIRSVNSYAFISDRGDTIGQMFLELFEGNERRLTGDEITEQIRRNTSDLAGISIELLPQEMGPPVGKPVYIEVSSYQRALLEPAIEKIRGFMEENVNGLRDVDDSRDLPGIEFRLNIDKAKASMYGADVSQVGMAVQLVTNGIKVGEYRPDRADDGVDIRVRYPTDDRTIQALEELRVMTNSGLVPISNFVSLEPMQKVSTIRRVDGIPVKEVRANVAPGVLADDKVREIEEWISTQTWHPELNIKFRGANEEQQGAMDFVGVAFSLSLLFMFVLLVTQFNSFYQSALILFAVVLSTAGVLIGLLITGNPFSSVMTGVGVVALAGIVVNNNIVLIDTFNNLRAEHPESDYLDLLVRTGAQRLRPVILTSTTTILGLLPLASNVSIDLINRTIIFGSSLSAFWVPLSQAIVSGLTVATLLTLVTTPAMLAMPYQLKSFMANRFKQKPFDQTVSP